MASTGELLARVYGDTQPWTARCHVGGISAFTTVNATNVVSRTFGTGLKHYNIPIIIHFDAS